MLFNGVRVLVALLEILETDEKRGRIVLVLAIEQAVAVDDGDAFDRRVVLEEIAGDLADRAGAIQAGGVGHDHRPQQITLVFRRQESAGDALGHQHHQHDHPGEQQKREGETLDQECHRARVALGHALETALEPTEEGVLLAVLRLEQQGGEGG
ncbi:hypothetical protein D3C73_1300720 [compost metagenome]